MLVVNHREDRQMFLWSYYIDIIKHNWALSLLTFALPDSPATPTPILETETKKEGQNKLSSLST